MNDRRLVDNLKKWTLAQRIAAVIEPAAWGTRHTVYGLSSERALLDQTLTGAVRSDSLKRADKILRMVRKRRK